MTTEGIHILIAEDEKKIAEALNLGLTENGYRVTVANDGKKATDKLGTQTFDLIILDINLPEINGYDLCKLIRNQDTDIPIIMLTALGALNNKIEGYEAGADDYLVKPFEFKELLLKIRVLLRRSAQVTQNENLLTAADLEMNLDSKQVTRGGQLVNLTVKEFELLEYLLRNKNRVASRAEIAMHVWQIDFDTNTNIIDVYISYLRNKVDKNFSPKLIYTQVGMGFIIKENNDNQA